MARTLRVRIAEAGTTKIYAQQAQAKLRSRRARIRHTECAGCDCEGSLPSQPVPRDAPKRAHCVAPADLLACRVAAAVVADGHLLNAEPRRRHLRRKLRLHAKAVLGDVQARQHVAMEGLVASLHVGQMLPRAEVRGGREQSIAQAMNEHTVFGGYLRTETLGVNMLDGTRGRLCPDVAPLLVVEVLILLLGKGFLVSVEEAAQLFSPFVVAILIAHRLDTSAFTLKMLGRMLGDVIREQEGEASFELVEKIRTLSVAFRRDADQRADRALKQLLKGLPARETLRVIRAFTYFSHLVNLAEDRHLIRRRTAALPARGQAFQ